MNFISSLAPWQWLVIGLVPPAIIALYFLKLKRQPLEVPSTYLWSRTIEDLHVNSIWQRLRQSLLLFLQLLLLVLLMFACLRPGWRGAKLTGDRFIFLIDTSASMSATDVKPTRLELAKEQVLGMIGQMKSDDVAMVISFSDAVGGVQSFTNSRSLLRQYVNQVKPTNRTSDLREALRAAAGLANPGRTSDKNNVNDVQVADPLPATLYLLTDGGFSSVPDFSLGNLEPIYIPIGVEEPENVAIVAFTAERNPEKPDQLEAFARLTNSGQEDVTADVSLYLDDQLEDTHGVTVAAGKEAGVEFRLEAIDQGVLRLELGHKDSLQLDNVAYTAINKSRRARVLLITPGNTALEWALDTEEVLELATVAVAGVSELDKEDHQDLAAAGYYDLIIYDRCVPKKMPQANTMFMGRLPPVKGWEQGEKEVLPIVIDTDRVHPLTLYIEMGNVAILEGRSVKAPPGGTVLIDSDVGTLLAIGPREGFEDAVLGFAIVDDDEKGSPEPKTDWPKRRSFPVFVMNVVRYLGGNSGSTVTPTVKPGNQIQLRTQSPAARLTIEAPNARRSEVLREGQNTFAYNDTDLLGIYRVFEGRADKPAQQFAVNLFDSRESDLAPTKTIKFPYVEVEGQVGVEPSRTEAWKWLLIAGIVVLVFEWYVYNRRVYL